MFILLRSQFVDTVILGLGASKNLCFAIKIYIKTDFPFLSLLKLYIWSDTFLICKKSFIHFCFIHHDMHFGCMLEKQQLLP